MGSKLQKFYSFGFLHHIKQVKVRDNSWSQFLLYHMGAGSSVSTAPLHTKPSCQLKEHDDSAQCWCWHLVCVSERPSQLTDPWAHQEGSQVNSCPVSKLRDGTGRGSRLLKKFGELNLKSCPWRKTNWCHVQVGGLWPGSETRSSLPLGWAWRNMPLIPAHRKLLRQSHFVALVGPELTM